MTHGRHLKKNMLALNSQHTINYLHVCINTAKLYLILLPQAVTMKIQLKVLQNIVIRNFPLLLISPARFARRVKEYIPCLNALCLNVKQLFKLFSV